MKYVEFCYWLQGAFELGAVKELSAEQIQVINNHLNMTEIHETNVVQTATVKTSKDSVFTGVSQGVPVIGQNSAPHDPDEFPSTRC